LREVAIKSCRYPCEKERISTKRGGSALFMPRTLSSLDQGKQTKASKKPRPSQTSKDPNFQTPEKKCIMKGRGRVCRTSKQGIKIEQKN